MKKYIYLTSIALAGLFAACNDDYVDKFDISYDPTDVKSIDYTLTASDYSTIASNSTNQELALSKDPEGQTYLNALTDVGKNKYFTDDAPADEYIPALIAAKYPNADLGSKFNVTYNTKVAESEYLSTLNNISSYTLTTDDYKTVWGTKVEANFLTPQSVSQIPALLAAAYPDADEGDLVVANYAYSATEPSIGGGGETPAEPTWTAITPAMRGLYNSGWNYVNVGPVDLSNYKGQTVNVAFKFTNNTVNSYVTTWEIQNFRAGKVPYVNLVLFKKNSDGDFVKVKKASEFTVAEGGTDYVIAALWSDGNYYPFGRIASDKSYGYVTPTAITVTSGKIAAADAADHVVTLEAGTAEGSYTIKNAIDKYFYSSYNSKSSYWYNSFNVADAVDNTDAKGFDWVFSNINSANDLWVVKNATSGNYLRMTVYSGTIEFGNWPESTVENNYASYKMVSDATGFVTSGTEGIWTNNQYGWVAKGLTVGTADECMLICTEPITIDENATLPFITFDEVYRNAGDVESELQVLVSTDYSSIVSAAGNAVRMANAMSTRASSEIQATNAVLYTYNGTAWTEYSNTEANVSVFGPEDYDALGSSTVTSPDYVLPTYLSKKYPYAEVGTKAAVVYNTSKGMTASEYTFNSAYTWEPTPAYTTETTTFSADADGISANLSVYIDATFLGTSGGFETQDVLLSGTLSYVWANSSTYGWKASAYLNKTNNPSESWLVSPAMNFKKAQQPILTFEEVHQYLSGAEPSKYLNVMVSTDYNGDVEKCTWTVITDKITNWSTGSDWTYVNVGQIDLSAFKGGKAWIAFKYTSDADAAATWEIKNLKVAESSYLGQ